MDLAMHGMGARQHEKARPIGEKRQVSWATIPSVRDDVLLGFQANHRVGAWRGLRGHFRFRHRISLARTTRG
ncbi:hypothetical protein [Xanthomonas euvesicatoria]|uniref:hypothetical protein n=1 Tax=Xanthomonas euvesicatoria TaxID=456327 RepID=UPI0006D68EBA|nr:hypothetical protein [Xanthomonas euvesicatoria]